VKTIKGNWYVVALWLTVRRFWANLPGPWYVKVIILLAFIACLAIPGPADEIALAALIAWWGRRQSRKSAIH
jgi:hypothetical protein